MTTVGGEEAGASTRADAWLPRGEPVGAVATPGAITPSAMTPGGTAPVAAIPGAIPLTGQRPRRREAPPQAELQERPRRKRKRPEAARQEELRPKAARPTGRHRPRARPAAARRAVPRWSGPRRRPR